MNILLVDDDEMLRRSIVRALTRVGHRATEAADAQEAILTLSKQQGSSDPFDVLITDMVMDEGSSVSPALTGTSVIEFANNLENRPACVLMGGGFEPGVAKHKGEYCLIGKPFRIAELVQAIDMAMSSLPARDNTHPESDSGPGL